MLGFALLSMLIGRLVCGEKGLRPVYVIATGMRNVAVCLPIAVHTFPDARVQRALIVFSLLMAVPTMLVYYYHLIRTVGPALLARATEEAGQVRQRIKGTEDNT